MEKNRVAFEKRFLTPHSSPKIQILQNTDDTRDFVKFKNSFYAATGGGLAAFDESGVIEKHFTVTDGLPESDLTALAVFGNKLFIGTRTKSLVVFDGEKFENYVFTDRKIQAVTAFAESDGRLLIGTFGGGLLEYDGADFTEIKADDKKIPAVNCLYKNGAKLYVGTFDNGLYIYENGVWTQFTTAEIYLQTASSALRSKIKIFTSPPISVLPFGRKRLSHTRRPARAFERNSFE